MNLQQLKHDIENSYQSKLQQSIKEFDDALIVYLINDVILEIRIANQQEYSFTWRAEDSTYRIDTAPLHPDLSSFPNHLHLSNGSVLADNITSIENPVMDNVNYVINQLLANPHLSIQ